MYLSESGEQAARLLIETGRPTMHSPAGWPHDDCASSTTNARVPSYRLVVTTPGHSAKIDWVRSCDAVIDPKPVDRRDRWSSLGRRMATVQVRLDGGENLVTASITKEAAEELGLTVGQSATVLIKSTDVAIGVQS